MNHALGIDLGGTQIKAIVVDENGAILGREVRPTGGELTPGRPWAFTIRELARDLGRDLPIGISTPGLIAKDRRTVASNPNRLPGLEAFDWTDWLERETLVPLTNDAHASLLGEAWIGAARGLENVVMLTLGTGVGGAAICDGRLLRGNLGRAGHFGHLCLDLDSTERSIVGTPGALECFLGNFNIRERSSGAFETTHALIEAYRCGDENAARIWLRSIHALACGITSIINAIDPEAIVLGGGIAQAGDALFTPLAEALAKFEWRPAGQNVRLLPAELGEWAGAIGAAYSALTASRTRPCPPSSAR